MPSNKILTVIILCFGVVISIWLFAKKPAEISIVEQKPASLSAGTYKNVNENLNTDWKSILTNINPKDQVVTDLTKNNSPAFDETTLTAQMARDFFSRYLLIAKNGQTVTPDQANKIAQDTLTLPAYTETKGAVYLVTNLHVNPKTDRETAQKYSETLVKSFQNINSKTPIDSLLIVSTAMNANNPDELAKLDPMIADRKKIVSDLLNMEVPANAVTVHLALLNAYSNFLADLEALRVSFSDPIKGFAGIGQYEKNISDLKTALTNINTFILKNS